MFNTAKHYHIDRLITPDFYLKELILIYFDVAKLN